MRPSWDGKQIPLLLPTIWVFLQLCVKQLVLTVARDKMMGMISHGSNLLERLLDFHGRLPDILGKSLKILCLKKMDSNSESILCKVFYLTHRKGIQSTLFYWFILALSYGQKYLKNEVSKVHADLPVGWICIVKMLLFVPHLFCPLLQNECFIILYFKNNACSHIQKLHLGHFKCLKPKI